MAISPPPIAAADEADTQSLIKRLQEYGDIQKTHGHVIGADLSREAAEMLGVTDYGYRMISAKNDELQTLCGELTKALRVRPTSTERDAVIEECARVADEQSTWGRITRVRK